MSDLDVLTQALLMTGGDPAVLRDAQTAHLLVSCHRVVSQHEIPGVTILVAESPAPLVTGKVVIGKGKSIEKPVHLCFGIPRFSGEQEAKLELVVEDEAHATVFLHSLFPEVKDAAHRMDLSIHVGQGSSLTLREDHFHGPHGWMRVQARSMIAVEKAGTYTSQFWLVKGKVGNLTRDSVVKVGEHAVADLKATVLGYGEDEVQIKDTVVLSGERAQSSIQTVVVVTGDAKADITALTEAHEQGAEGRMHCIGLIKDKATATVSPLAKVFHPLAEVTQKAMVRGVDKTELENLISWGLVPGDAIDLIIRGVVR
jgi:Fe-S cluster assembly scaffold protein SufB